MNPAEENPNPILARALGIINGIAPGALEDPEKAFRELVPRLRFLVVAPVENPTTLQLEAIRVFDNSRSLVQLRKAIQVGELRFGPFPGDLAERLFIPRLTQVGLSVSLRELTDEENDSNLSPSTIKRHSESAWHEFTGTTAFNTAQPAEFIRLRKEILLRLNWGSSGSVHNASFHKAGRADISIVAHVIGWNWLDSSTSR